MSSAARCLVLALLLLVGGCERVVFDTAPVMADCDERLAGHWQSFEKNERDAESAPTPSLEVQVESDCQARFWNSEQQPRRALEPTRLHSASIDRVHYLWVDAGWANRAFEVTPGPLDDGPGFYLFKIEFGKDRLKLWPMSAKTLAPYVLEGDVEGDIFKRDYDLMVRVRGDANNTKLALKHLRRQKGVDPLLLIRADKD